MIDLHDILDYAKPWLILAGIAIVFGLSFAVGDFALGVVGFDALDPSDMSETLEHRGGGVSARRGRGILTIALMIPKAAIGSSLLTLAAAPFVVAYVVLRRPPGDSE